MSDSSSYIYVDGYSEPLCECVEVLEKSVNIETGEEALLIKVHSKANGQPFTIPRAQLIKRSLFDTLTMHGLSVIETDSSYAELRGYIIESELKAPVVYTHESLGFREFRETSCFLGWKPIGDLPLKYMDSKNPGMQKMLEPSGNFDQWKQFVREYVVPNAELSLALMLGATAPVSYVLKEEGEFDSVPVWALVNKSSRGKTTSLYLVASLFGNPRYFIDNFNATGNALYAMLEQRGGLPFLCDEATYTPNLDWDAMLYTFPTGKERRRCDSKGKLKPMVEFGGAIIMTSEVSILDRSQKNEGQKCRIIELETDPFNGNPRLAEQIRSFCFKNYGWATEPLITLLLDPAERRKLIDTYEHYYNKLEKTVQFDVGGVERRLLQRFALILASGNLLRKAVQCNFDLRAIEQYLLNHITQQIQSHDDRDQADILIDKVTNFVCANKDKFPTAASFEKTALFRHRGAFYGCFGFSGSKSCIWIQEDILRDRILPKEMQTATTTMQVLREKGYVQVFYDDRYRIRKKFGEIQGTYYCFLPPETSSLYQIIDEITATTSATSVATLNARLAGDGGFYKENYKILNAERDIPYLALGRAGNKSFSLYASKAFCKGMAMSSRSTLYAAPVPSEKVLLLTKEKSAVNSLTLNFVKYNEGMVALGLSVPDLLDKLAIQIPVDHQVIFQEIEVEEFKDKPAAAVNYDEPFVAIEKAEDLPVDYTIKSYKQDGEPYKNNRSLLEDDDDDFDD